LNRLLSLGQDILWRNKLVKLHEKGRGLHLLDLATGTGDILLTFLKKRKDMDLAFGLDMSENMLKLADKKIRDKGFEEKTLLIRGDANFVPISADNLDMASMAFGIRNITKPLIALKEINRVLKKGGKTYILEFSIPKSRIMRFFFLLYLRNIVPLIGGIVSGDMSSYRYLNKTIESFPHGKNFGKLMKEAGFVNIEYKPLTFGIATIYIGEKS